jgi:hypothetical protein
MSEQAVDTTVSGEIQAVKPHDRFRESLQRQAAAEQVYRADEVSASQIDRILSATTEEEIWESDEGGVVSSQDMEDIELHIRGYGIAESSSEYKSTLGVFALIDAVRMDTGEEVIVNTGSDLIISKLAMFKAHNLLPIEGVIKGTPTRSGGRLMRLKPIPKRAINPGTSVE